MIYTQKRKKEIFYEALKKSLGNVTAACQATGFKRTTHYSWMNTDEEYRQKVLDIAEIEIDFVENMLKKRIQEGDNACIIFYLKTKGRARGYIERQEILSQNVNININSAIEDAYKSRLEKENSLVIEHKVEEK